MKSYFVLFLAFSYSFSVTEGLEQKQVIEKKEKKGGPKEKLTEEKYKPGEQTIFKWVDESGKVHYSDIPQKHAEEVVVKDVQTVKIHHYDKSQLNLPNALPEIKDPHAKLSNTKNSKPYSSVAITRPVNEQVVVAESGKIDVTVSVSPKVNDKFQFRLKLNGNTVKTQKALTFSDINVILGTHGLVVEVIDESGAIVQSSDSIAILVYAPSVSDDEEDDSN